MKFKDLEIGDKFKTYYVDHRNGATFIKKKRGIKRGHATNCKMVINEYYYKNGYFFGDSEEVVFL